MVDPLPHRLEDVVLFEVVGGELALEAVQLGLAGGEGGQGGALGHVVAVLEGDYAGEDLVQLFLGVFAGFFEFWVRGDGGTGCDGLEGDSEQGVLAFDSVLHYNFAQIIISAEFHSSARVRPTETLEN
jgi:hypothetical protein